METTTAATLARTLMNEHGLGHWTFQFDRATVRLGSCHHGRQRITLSERIVRITDEATVRNTILHEIAHALVGPGHGHGYTWMSKAISIGCDGRRCHSVDTWEVAKWLGTCGCGRKYRRHRLTKNVREHGRCPGCKTGITWVDTHRLAA